MCLLEGISGITYPLRRFGGVDSPIGLCCLAMMTEKRPNPSPQLFILVSHRREWRQFPEIRFARIFSSKMNLCDPPRSTKTFCTWAVCTVREHLCVFTHSTHQQDILFSEDVKCHIFHHVFYSTFCVKKKKDLFPLCFTEGHPSNESLTLTVISCTSPHHNQDWYR